MFYVHAAHSSDSDGNVAAIAYTLSETASLSGVDPQVWPTEVLERIPEHNKINRVDELLTWNCTSTDDRPANA